MVQFKSNNNNKECFSFDVIGNQTVYIDTIKALLFFLGHCNADYEVNNELYCISNLIDGMLPDESQIINLEDVELFQKFKEQKHK